MPHDTEYTREPVCPRCGHVQRDAWEINFGPGLDGEAEIECGACDEPMLVVRDVSVSYSTMLPKGAA